MNFTYKRIATANAHVRHIPPNLSLPEACLASKRHLTFRGERTKVTARPGRFFNFTLFLRGDTSNNGGPPRKRETQCGSDVSARPRR